MQGCPLNPYLKLFAININQCSSNSGMHTTSPGGT